MSDRHVLVMTLVMVAPTVVLAVLLLIHTPSSPTTPITVLMAGGQLAALALFQWQLRRERRVEHVSGADLFRYAWWVRHGYLAVALAVFVGVAVLWGAGTPERERRGSVILFALGVLGLSVAVPVWLRAARQSPDIAWTEQGLRVRPWGEPEVLVSWGELRGIEPLIWHPLGVGMTLAAGDLRIPISSGINGYLILCQRLRAKADELGIPAPAFGSV